MATVLNLKYRPTKPPMEDLAREILELRGTNKVIEISDPELLLCIDDINSKEVECRLSVEMEDGSYSYGYEISDELRAILMRDRENKNQQPA